MFAVSKGICRLRDGSRQGQSYESENQHQIVDQGRPGFLQSLFPTNQSAKDAADAQPPEAAVAVDQRPSTTLEKLFEAEPRSNYSLISQRDHWIYFCSLARGQVSSQRRDNQKNGRDNYKR